MRNHGIRTSARAVILAGLLGMMPAFGGCDSSGPSAPPQPTWIDATFVLVSVDGTPVPGVVQTFESSVWRVEESRLVLRATGQASLYRRSTAIHHANTEAEIEEEGVLDWSGPYGIEGDRIWLERRSTECDDVAQCPFAEVGRFADDVVELVPSSWGDRTFRYVEEK